MKNETAIQQLFSAIELVNVSSPNNPLIEALLKSKARLMEIEKQQIIEAYDKGYLFGETNIGEDHYDETYGD